MRCCFSGGGAPWWDNLVLSLGYETTTLVVVNHYTLFTIGLSDTLFGTSWGLLDEESSI